ncbi:hypothetical protein [Halorussus amylolyticus]|uniref:hypothetical protein n=1 Tax=Halorussus amylolyticus TaxID=1126242 RepID=UPI00138EDBE1|nr:hypothetical protein [Halorussus amylolyticus]
MARDSVFQLDCEFCDSKVEAEAVARAKTRASDHLQQNHHDGVVAELGDRYDEIACESGCGYTFPVGVEDVTGMNCPKCGHDNAESLLERYVYWQIAEK